MPAIAGDLVAGVLKGAAEGMKVIFGTDKPQKDSHVEAVENSLDDERLNAARKLHGLRDAGPKG